MPRKKLQSSQLERGRKFGLLLKQNRERKNLSQNDLAVRSGVSVDTIRSIEGGRIPTPGLFMAVDLVRALEGNIEAWMKTIDAGHGTGGKRLPG